MCFDTHVFACLSKIASFVEIYSEVDGFLHLLKNFTTDCYVKFWCSFLSENQYFWFINIDTQIPGLSVVFKSIKAILKVFTRFTYHNQVICIQQKVYFFFSYSKAFNSCKIFLMSLIKILNKVGLRLQPCLTPRELEKNGVIPPWHFTPYSVVLYMFSIILIILPLTPLCRSQTDSLPVRTLLCGLPLSQSNHWILCISV